MIRQKFPNMDEEDRLFRVVIGDIADQCADAAVIQENGAGASENPVSIRRTVV